MAANDISRNKRLLTIARHLLDAGSAGLGTQALLGKLGFLEDDMLSRSGRKSRQAASEPNSRRKMLQRDLHTLIQLGYAKAAGNGCARHYVRTTLPIEAEVDALVMDRLTLLRSRCDEQNKPINMLPLLRKLLDPQGSMSGECLQIEADSFQLIPAPIRQSFLEESISALRDGQLIELVYRNREGIKSSNVLTPLYLKIKGAGLYLRSRKEDGQERDYALQRFVSIQRLDKFIEDESISSATTPIQERIQVCMKVSRAMEATLQDCKISQDQRITPLEGDATMVALVEASVVNEPCFLRWILSWCNEIEVLEPEILREQVKNKLALASRRYELSKK